jgi:hypothetical protein
MDSFFSRVFRRLHRGLDSQFYFGLMAQQALNSLIAGPHAGWLHELFVFLSDSAPIYEVHIDPNRTSIPGPQYVTLSRINGSRLFMVSVKTIVTCFCYVMCFLQTETVMFSGTYSM